MVAIGTTIVKIFLRCLRAPTRARYASVKRTCTPRTLIRSMRQDLSMLAVTNFAVLLVLVFALVLKL